MKIGELDKALKGSNPADILALLEAIPKGRDPEISSVICSRLMKKSASSLALLLLQVLRNVGDESCMPVVERYAKSPSVEVRVVAIATMLDLAQKHALRFVIESATADPSPLFRETCMKYLKPIGRPAIQPLLNEMKQHVGTWLHRAAERFAAYVHKVEDDVSPVHLTIDTMWKQAKEAQPKPPTTASKKSDISLYYGGEISIDGLFDEDEDSEIQYDEPISSELKPPDPHQ